MVGLLSKIGALVVASKFIKWVVGLEAVTKAKAALLVQLRALHLHMLAAEAGYKTMVGSFLLGAKQIARGAIFGGLAMGANALGVALKALALKFAPIAIAIGVLYIAGKQLKGMFDANAEEAELLSARTDTLASSMGIASKSLQDYRDQWKLIAETMDEVSGEFETVNARFIDALSNVDDERRADMVMAVLTELNGRGATEEEITNTLKAINDALPESKEIEIKISFDTPENAMDSVEGAWRELERQRSETFNIVTGIFDDPLGKKYEAAVDSAAEAFQRLWMEAADPNNTVEQRMRAFQEFGVQIKRIEEEASDTFSGRKDMRNFMREVLLGIEDLAGVDLKTTHNGLHQIEEVMARLMRQGGMRGAGEDLLEGFGWKREDIEAMDFNEMAKLLVGRINKSIAQNEFIVPGFDRQSLDDSRTELEVWLGDIYETLRQSGDTSAAGTFAKDRIDELVGVAGHARAIEVIEDHIEAMGGLEWAYQDQVGRQMVSTLKTLKDEWNNMGIEEILKQANSMPLQNAIALVTEKVRELRAEAGRVTPEIEKLFQAGQDLIDQRVAQLHGFVQQERQLNENIIQIRADGEERRQEMETQYAKQREKAAENNAKQITKLEERRDESLARLAEQHKDRLKEITKAEAEALENHAKAMARSIGITRRSQSQQTMSLGAMVVNTSAQNDLMQGWKDAVGQLKNMGLNEEVMKAMGIDDPQNWQQAQRTLRGALANPNLINEINALWKDRLDITEAATEGFAGNQVREQFDKQREQLEESLEKSRQEIHKQHDRSLKDLAESYAEQQRNMAESHRESVERLATSTEKSVERVNKQIADLGKNTALTTEETLKAAADSASEHLRSMVKDVKDSMFDLEQATLRAQTVTGDWGEALDMTFVNGINKAREFKAALGDVSNTIRDINAGNITMMDAITGGMDKAVEFWTGTSGLKLPGPGADGPESTPMGGMPDGIGQGMVMPVPGGRFINDWGFPRGGGRTHQGTDIFAASGTAVYAMRGGNVVRAVNTDSGLGGKRVWVAGSDGLYYYYAHLSSVNVREGQKIPVGGKLGAVGNTGNARTTPPHLHLGMARKYASGYINPYPFLKGSGSGGSPPKSSTESAKSKQDVNQSGGAAPIPRTSPGQNVALAWGGIATSEVNAKIAEAGYPEAVMPLNRRGAEFMAMMLKRYSTPSNMGSSASYDQSTNFTGPVTVKANDPREIAHKLARQARHRRLTRPGVMS
jgi:murein DD-endopeptidase MepM/ murein hydrolase activator NlpD